MEVLVYHEQHPELIHHLHLDIITIIPILPSCIPNKTAWWDKIVNRETRGSVRFCHSLASPSFSSRLQESSWHLWLSLQRGSADTTTTNGVTCLILTHGNMGQTWSLVSFDMFSGATFSSTSAADRARLAPRVRTTAPSQQYIGQSQKST